MTAATFELEATAKVAQAARQEAKARTALAGFCLDCRKVLLVRGMVADEAERLLGCCLEAFEGSRGEGG